MSPVAFPPPPTSNTLSSRERSALVRSSRKLSKVLGEVPRVLDQDVPPLPSSSTLDLTRTVTATSTSESAWNKRKPTHLPPLLKFSTPSAEALDSPMLVMSPRPPSHRSSVLSIVSNASSGSSTSDTSSESAYKRSKLEHLRRKLGEEVPATAVFPATPRTAVPRTSNPATPTSRHTRSRTRSTARRADDTRSITFSISSDESMHTFTFTAARVHSPRPRRTKHVYQTGALPPVPPIPAHLVSGATSGRASNDDDDDAGLVRPRQKMAAGSRIGGADFKAARRAKREGKTLNGTAEPGEMIEMVGFMF